jgi:AbrB family looped-hinge helix DNA binding protein
MAEGRKSTRISRRLQGKAPAGSLAPGFAEDAPEWKAQLPERLDVQVGPGGRIVIPAVFRAAMQVKEGDRLMARVVDGELRLITPNMAIAWAQKMVRETISGEDSLVDTLLEQRRQEFEDEFRDG